MRKTDFTKIYSIIGKVLCSIAGAIIGFVAGGIYWAIPGILVGVIIAHFLGKYTSDLSLKSK